MTARLLTATARVCVCVCVCDYLPLTVLLMARRGATREANPDREQGRSSIPSTQPAQGLSASTGSAIRSVGRVRRHPRVHLAFQHFDLGASGVVSAWEAAEPVGDRPLQSIIADSNA